MASKTLTSSAAAEVENLVEFQRELRKLGKEWPRQLRLANKKTAELVAEKSKAAAEGQGGVAAHNASSIKAKGESRYAIVQVGGEDWPSAMGALFGAVRFSQFKPWRGNKADAGYFIFPEIRENSELIVETYAEMIDALARNAFPD